MIPMPSIHTTTPAYGGEPEGRARKYGTGVSAMTGTLGHRPPTRARSAAGSEMMRRCRPLRCRPCWASRSRASTCAATSNRWPTNCARCSVHTHDVVLPGAGSRAGASAAIACAVRTHPRRKPRRLRMDARVDRRRRRRPREGRLPVSLRPRVHGRAGPRSEPLRVGDSRDPNEHAVREWDARGRANGSGAGA